MKIFKIPNEIFNVDTVVVVGTEIDKIKQRLKREYDETLIDQMFDADEIAGCFAFVDSLSRKDGEEDDYILYLEKADMGDLVHELVHLTWNVLSDREVELEQKDNEAQAYLFVYYYNKIIKELKR